MRKFILKIVVCLALLICCFPTTVRAANVARVESSGFEYATLQEAIDAAEANGDTVYLLADITLEAANNISIVNRSIIIDGNNFTITYNGGVYASAVFVQAANRNVTLKKLKIYAKDAENGIVVTTKCNLTLENVEVSGGAGPGVPDRALFLNANTAYGTVNITNSKLEGNYGMYIFGEYMNINVNASSITSVDDSATEDFAAIILNGYNDYYHTNGTIVNVTGGSVKAYKEDGTTLSNAVINASATGKVNFDGTIVEGNVVYPVAVSGVSASNYEYFYSLQAAINDAVGTAKVVNVLRDIEIDEFSSIVIDGEVTIYGNGYTLTSLADKAIFIDTTDEVKINNYKIIGKPGRYGIAVVNKMALLKLDEVTVSVDNGCAIYVVGSGTEGSKVFAENSDLSGISAIALWSDGCGAQFTNTNLTGVCERTLSGTDFGVIDISADNVTVIVYGGVISATTQEGKERMDVVYIASGSDNAKVYLNNETTIQLNGTATIVNIDPFNNPSITLSAQYRQQLNNEGYGVTLPPNADGLVKIDYTIIVFEVKYVAEGTTVAVFGVQNGEAVANPPAVPAKAGYSGVWDHDGTNITADITITAVYTKTPVPETGDNINIMMWVTVMLISAAGVFGVIVYAKRKKLF